MGRFEAGKKRGYKNVLRQSLRWAGVKVRTSCHRRKFNRNKHGTKMRVSTVMYSEFAKVYLSSRARDVTSIPSKDQYSNFSRTTINKLFGNVRQTQDDGEYKAYDFKLKYMKKSQWLYVSWRLKHRDLQGTMHVES